MTSCANQLGPLFFISALLFSMTFAIGWLGERIVSYIASYHVAGIARDFHKASHFWSDPQR